MLLTPPDVISQSLLAIPMWVLFELGLIMSRLFIKKKNSITENAEYEIFDEDENPDNEKMESLFDEMEQEEADNNAKPE